MEQRVREWMGDQLVANTYEYFDGLDVDLTKLGEDAAETFDLYENVADIPEWVWEVAFEASKDFDQHRAEGGFNGRTGIRRGEESL